MVTEIEASSRSTGAQLDSESSSSKSVTPSDPTANPELQVKSLERVRDLGEVFTPSATVQEMLDLIPDHMWTVHPSATFLEPACGDGNFLVAILDRKLERITNEGTSGQLPAGDGKEALQFHALEALSSIYAVDISVDNIIGGTPGHEVGARDRLLTHLRRWYIEVTGTQLTDRSPLVLVASWIIERNVLVGNMLPFNPDGATSGRENLPLVEYHWDPTTASVTLLTTTLGAAAELAAAEAGSALTLFGPVAPIEVWSGKALRMNSAPIPAPIPAVTHTSNGKGVGSS